MARYQVQTPSAPMHGRTPRRGERASRGLAVAGAFAFCLSLVLPGTAFAGSMSLGVASQPVQELTTQITYTAETTEPGFVTIKVNTASVPCASEPESDAGATLVAPELDTAEQTGTFDGSFNYTPSYPGTYNVCGWVNGWGAYQTHIGGPTVASTTMQLDVREPHITLALAVPHRLHPRKHFSVRLTASSEVKRVLIVLAVPEIHGCPIDPAATTANNLLETDVEGGPRTFTATVAPLTGHSRWIFCAYAEPPAGKGEHPQATTSATLRLVTRKPMKHNHR